MAEPIYKLEKLNFDGPLDLLLQLLEKNKVDIYDIPIAAITEQYIAYVNSMDQTDLDMISDFLLMAATLLDIKSRMLLPKEVNEEGEEIDPREELTERLLQYKRFKYISHELRLAEEYADRFIYSEAELPEEFKKYVPPVDLDKLFEGVDLKMLHEIYEKVLKRSASMKDEVRSGFGQIRRERVSLSGCIRSLVSFARNKRRFSFRQMLKDSKDKTEVVVSFLAVLELMKAGKLLVEQDEYSREIDVQVTDDIDLDDFDFAMLEDA